MRIVFKFFSNIFFLIFLCIEYIKKSVTYTFSMLKLRIQERAFYSTKKTVLQEQRKELNRINRENTKKNLKELADLLNLELNRYNYDIDEDDINRLKKMIKKSVNEMSLKNLTILYKIFFETPKIDVLNKVDKLLKTDAFSDTDKEG